MKKIIGYSMIAILVFVLIACMVVSSGWIVAFQMMSMIIGLCVFAFVALYLVESE